jgi:hypothetical protein
MDNSFGAHGRSLFEQSVPQVSQIIQLTSSNLNRPFNTNDVPLQENVTHSCEQNNQEFSEIWGE